MLIAIAVLIIVAVDWAWSRWAEPKFARWDVAKVLPVELPATLIAPSINTQVAEDNQSGLYPRDGETLPHAEFVEPATKIGRAA